MALDRIAVELVAGVTGLARQRGRRPCSMAASVPKGIDQNRLLERVTARLSHAGLGGMTVELVAGTGPVEVLAVEFSKWER